MESTSSSPSFTNRLIHETSPYLRQHAHNPVEWYPWGEKALGRAKAENKPILLSIGYSACHWCHVMERECFENPDIAHLMNDHFVNIKVDREERPDLDDIYQKAAQAIMGRGGGWPLTVFLTPSQEPYYAGTYFPPVPQHGLPGFPQVLLGIHRAFHEDPAQVQDNSRHILSILRRLATPKPSTAPLDESLFTEAAKDIEAYFEPRYGGFGQGPKFPMAAPFHVMLLQAVRTGNTTLQQHMMFSLQQIAAGGIYDHIGGGFHRYSVDAEWLVPHFEKMLYDNAQLVRLYLNGWRLTKAQRFKEVVEDTLAYIQREMLHPDGGFFSAQDADSEGEEGKFFTWTPDELKRVLGTERGEAFCRTYHITDHGNFEGKNICHLLRTQGVIDDSALPWIREARQILLTTRDQRVKPLRDEKILTSWNGLMVSAFVEASVTFGHSDYLIIAERALDFLLECGFSSGRLFRSIWNGQGKLNAYLDDYAFLIAALLDAFEATGTQFYLQRAQELTAIMVEQFWDEEIGAFFFTGKDHESLIQRMKPGHDSAIPSGNAVAAMNFFRLFSLTHDSLYWSRAEQILRVFRNEMAHNAYGTASLLAGLDWYLTKPKDVVVFGSQDDPKTLDLLKALFTRFLPHKTVYRVSPSDQPSWPSVIRALPSIPDHPTAWVCHDFTCSRPVTTAVELESLL